MKIHGLCLVKNEADVLQETLVSALHWCDDHIYVFDNGSNDGTWELVQELANQHLQIPLMHEHPVNLDLVDKTGTSVYAAQGIE